MEEFDIERRNARLLQMRQVGFSLREIGKRLGISGERVRQILTMNVGSTNYEWLTTGQLSEMSRLNYNRLHQLRKCGIIQPKLQLNRGRRCYFLWSSTSVEDASDYMKKHYSCCVCGRPLTKGRKKYCSDTCRLKRWKYCNRTSEQKEKVLAAIRRYRDKKRLATIQSYNLVTVH